MSREFEEAFNGDRNVKKFFKKTNTYDGVPHYLKSVTIKENEQLRVVIETPNPALARQFSFNEVIQLAFKEIDDDKFVYKTKSDRLEMAERLLDSMGYQYCYIQVESLDCYAYGSRKAVAVEAINLELQRQCRYEPLPEPKPEAKELPKEEVK